MVDLRRTPDFAQSLIDDLNAVLRKHLGVRPDATQGIVDTVQAATACANLLRVAASLHVAYGGRTDRIVGALLEQLDAHRDMINSALENHTQEP